MGAVGIFPYAAVTGNIGPERFVNEITRIGKQCRWRIIVMFEQIFYKPNEFVLIEGRFKCFSDEIYCLFVSHNRLFVK